MTEVRNERVSDLTSSADWKTKQTYITLEWPRVSEPVFQEQGNGIFPEEQKDTIDESNRVIDYKKLSNHQIIENILLGVKMNLKAADLVLPNEESTKSSSK